MDTYFIVFFDKHDNLEVAEPNNQEECEKELNEILQNEGEIIKIIVGEELTWKTHVTIKLKETKDAS